MKPRRISIIAVMVALCSVISLSVYHPYPYDNVVTRWGLAERLVQAGSLKIDVWSGLTSDKAGYEGHYYSDKSFMPSAAAALPAIPLRLFGGLSGPDEYPVGGVGRYLSERLTVSLALILLLLLLLKHSRQDGASGSIPVLAVGLGSILLPYSTLLYTHVPAAFLLFASYHAQRSDRLTASDVMGALAVAYEYTLIVPFAVLVLYRRREQRSILAAVRTVAILLLFFLPQLLHNWIAFGSPFSMGYSLEAESSFAVVSKGVFGFTYPSFQRLYMMLLSPERGIFFYMPWTALGLWGLLGGGKWRERLRSDPLPLLVLSYILLYSAQNASSAGWAYGYRYLIPVIPFMAVGLERFAAGSVSRASFAVAAILPGLLLSLLGTFGEIHLPVHPVETPVPLPQLNISLEMMLKGHHPVRLAGTAGALLLSAGAIACWFSVLRRTGTSLLGLLWIPPWILLALLSGGRDWGGKVDYYRGVLAHHRMEWELAAEYYERALEDETAPEVIRTRLEYVRSMAD